MKKHCLEEELPATGIHLFSFVHPFKLAVFGVKRALLQRPQLQREPWSQFLQTNLFRILENVSVVSKKDKVSLVVKGHNRPTCELWLLREQGIKQPSNLVPETCVELVQDHFRLVGSLPTAPLNLLVVLHRGQLKVCSWTVWQVADHEAGRLLPVLVDNNNVGVTTLGRTFNNLFQRCLLPRNAF